MKDMYNLERAGPKSNPINLIIYVAGGIIEWDFCGTGKEFFEDF